MPRKLAENQSYVSLQSALEMWHDTEEMYGVEIRLDGNPPKRVGKGFTQYLLLSAFTTKGTETRECIFCRGLVYPGAAASTYPVALINLISGLWARLEAMERGTPEALEQSAFDLPT